MPQIDLNKVFKAGLVVIIGGLFILGLTYIIPVLAPLIAIFIAAIIIYFAYLYFTGKL